MRLPQPSLPNLPLALCPLLLALALVLGQWLAAQHGPQHVDEPSGSSACVFCLAAPGGDGAAPVAPLAVTRVPGGHLPLALAAPTTASRAFWPQPLGHGPPA